MRKYARIVRQGAEDMNDINLKFGEEGVISLLNVETLIVTNYPFNNLNMLKDCQNVKWVSIAPLDMENPVTPEMIGLAFPSHEDRHKPQL